MRPSSSTSYLNCPLAFVRESQIKRIGLLVLSSDLTSEHDFFTMCRDPEIRIHVSRTAYMNPVTRENLQAMGDGLGGAVKLLDAGVRYDLIYFACTSASAVLGDSVVEGEIHRIRPGIPVVTPLTASLSALEALDAQKISILTPYTKDVARAVADYFVHHGVEVCTTCYLGLEDDRQMARLSPESIIKAASRAVQPGAEALFISCTALCSAQIAGKIEGFVGLPVVTSNNSAAWYALKSIGKSCRNKEYGRLWCRE